MGKPVRTFTPSGEEIVILAAADYDRLVEDLEDRADNLAADAALAEGGEWLTSEEVDELLAASTPLAFWRKRRGLTQAALAAQVGVTQSYVAQIEAGRRIGEVDLYRRLAEALGLKIEDLVPGG
ncbi:MAG: helix-turn-helix transcriptional regulator [Bauldia sp.]